MKAELKSQTNLRELYRDYPQSELFSKNEVVSPDILTIKGEYDSIISREISKYLCELRIGKNSEKFPYIKREASDLKTILTIEKILKEFEERNYEYFDPLVSDTACHIRAYFLIRFLKYPLYYISTYGRETILDFIVNIGFLTVSKSQYLNTLGLLLKEVTDPSKIKPLFNASSNRELNRICRASKSSVSLFGLRLLEDECSRLLVNQSLSQNTRGNIQAISEKFQQNIKAIEYSGAQLTVAPLFPTIDGILSMLKAEDTPIIVQLKQIYIEPKSKEVRLLRIVNYLYCLNKCEYICISHPNSSLDDTPCMTFQVLQTTQNPSNDMLRFRNIPFENIILASAANHPQYPSVLASETPELPDDYLQRINNFKTFALQNRIGQRLIQILDPENGVFNYFTDEYIFATIHHVFVSTLNSLQKNSRIEMETFGSIKHSREDSFNLKDAKKSTLQNVL